MGQCLSTVGGVGDTPERFRVSCWCPAGCWRQGSVLPAHTQHHRNHASTPLPQGRWAQQGGLGDGFAAFGDAGKYGVLGEPAKPAYTTTVRGIYARDAGESVQRAGSQWEPPLLCCLPPPPLLCTR